MAGKKYRTARLKMLKRPASDRYRNLSRASNLRKYQRDSRSRRKGPKQFKGQYGVRTSGSIKKRPAASVSKRLCCMKKRPAASVSSSFCEQYRQAAPCCGNRSYRCRCFVSGLGLKIANAISYSALRKVSNSFDSATIRIADDTADMPQYLAQMWHSQSLQYLFPYALLWRTFSNGYFPEPSQVLPLSMYVDLLLSRIRFACMGLDFGFSIHGSISLWWCIDICCCTELIAILCIQRVVC